MIKDDWLPVYALRQLTIKMYYFRKMNQPKLTVALLSVISILLVIVIYQLSQPTYVPVENGQYLNIRSGKFYEQLGNELVPAQEITMERLRRQYPDGQQY